MTSEIIEDEYIIHIDYDPNIDDLAASLQALSKIVAGHAVANNILSRAFDQQVVSSIAMQKIEKGSIRLFVKNVIKNTNKEEIKSRGFLAFIRQGMVDGRELFLDYIDENDSIKNIEDLIGIRGDLVTIANNAGADSTIGVETLSPKEISEVIGGLSLPNKELREGQKVKVIVAGKEHEVNRGFRFNATKVEELLLAEDQFWPNQQKRIRIKKLAYEGESQWLVQDIEGHNYKAKILDTEWLKKFQDGTLPADEFPRPKAILLVRGDITIQLDNAGFQKDKFFDIHEIISVENPKGSDSQLTIGFK